MAETYESRLNRINAAISLKEADRVPLIPIMQCYPVRHAGYTMADVLYDYDKGAEAYIKYAKDYDPDAVTGHSWIQMGMGPILELTGPRTMTWAGAPGTAISENSIHQWLEFPILEDDEMDMFRSDRSGWLLEKAFPRCFKVADPLANFGLTRMAPGMSFAQFAGAVSQPEVKKMIEICWKMNELNAELGPKSAQLDKTLEEMGYPVLNQGFAGVPFDGYSDFYRGTINSMTDLYEYEDIIQDFRERQMESTMGMLKMQGQMLPGRWVFMALHKGMDGFMSDEQYRKYYWSDLQAIIEEIIKNGMTPYIYTEGDYNTRLDCLKEVTAGKVIYHFETVDMANAKKVLGDTACISGGFPVYLLEHGTRQQVIDEAKRLIDICAPGGGYIFETNCGLDNPLPGNLEALMETVREYGKY